MTTKPTSEEGRALESWQGRWLLDGFENRLGCVREVSLCDGSIELVAVFEGDGPREISTKERSDGEFVHPDSVRARYRILSDEDARDLLRRRRSSESS